MSIASTIDIGIDVGGSSIKAAAVDTASAAIVGTRRRVELAGRWQPESIVATVADCVGELLFELSGDTGDVRVGIGFPAVVVDGTPRTDPTALRHPGFRGVDLRAALSEAVGRPVVLLNDADAAGLGEVRHGAASDASGTVIVVTLGTGVGSGLFRNGMLVPNLELGHLYLAGEPEVVELSMAARIKAEQGLDWDTYSGRLNEFLRHVIRVFCPDLLVLGGGITGDDRDADELFRRIDATVPVLRARFANDAGLIGAAASAREPA